MSQAEASSPSGVLYFSNGTEIEKLDLKMRKREIVIPKFDGEEPTTSVYPVYSSKRNKMYFFRSYAWPTMKCHLVVYDFIHQRIEKTLDFCGDALSLSRDESFIAYFWQAWEKPYSDSSQLYVRDISNHREQNIANDISLFSEPAIWLSNLEILYTNSANEITKINIRTKEKQKWGHKGITQSSLSPDGTQILGVDRQWPIYSTIYALNIMEQTRKPIKRVFYCTISGGTFIWSPDGKSFVYTRRNLTNLIPFEEVGHLYWHNLTSGKEIKLADKVTLLGGFWLPEDPAMTQTEQGIKNENVTQ